MARHGSQMLPGPESCMINGQQLCEPHCLAEIMLQGPLEADGEKATLAEQS